MINEQNAVIIELMKNNRVIIEELKTALIAHFGEDIIDVILFGSQASGKAHKDSDFDILIVLGNDYTWVDEEKIISVVYSIELKHEIFIDLKLISKRDLFQTIKGKHPLYRDAIYEGIHA